MDNDLATRSETMVNGTQDSHGRTSSGKRAVDVPKRTLPTMSLRSEIDILRHIATQNLTRLLPPQSSCNQPEPSLPHTVPLNGDIFPEPQPITSDLIAMGVNPSIAAQFSSIYLRTAMQLRSECDGQYRRANCALSQNNCGNESTRSQSLLRSVYISKYASMLKAWSDKIVKEYGPRALQVKHAREVETTSSRRAFNQVSAEYSALRAVS